MVDKGTGRWRQKKESEKDRKGIPGWDRKGDRDGWSWASHVAQRYRLDEKGTEDPIWEHGTGGQRRHSALREHVACGGRAEQGAGLKKQGQETKSKLKKAL